MSRLLGGTSGRISMSANVSCRSWHSGKRVHRKDVETPLEEPKRQPKVLICTNANASIKWANQLVFTSVSGGRSFLETVARMPVRSVLWLWLALYVGSESAAPHLFIPLSLIFKGTYFLNENLPSRIQEVESGGVHSMNPITPFDIRRCAATWTHCGAACPLLFGGNSTEARSRQGAGLSALTQASLVK